MCFDSIVAQDIANEIFLAFLQRSWLNAKDSANSLRDQLVADQQAALALIASGSVASVGKNSTSQSYKGFGPGSLTQEQITRLFTRLISGYDAAKERIDCAFARAGKVVLDNFDYDGAQSGEPVGVYQILYATYNISGRPVRGDITDLNLTFAPPVTPLDQSLEPQGVNSW